MDFDFSDEELAFREEVRTWLAEHVPADKAPEDGPAMRDYDLAWQRTQYDGGWAGISWPVQFGGRGLSTIEQLIWFEEYARAGAPSIGANFVGINHAGPTLIARASDGQRAAHLPPILRGDVVWCQGFSEPGAGSDLAGLQTRGEIDGDELVVTGSKVWTSFANLADYQELLVRTDRDAPKHKGITWIICDMRSPGIEVRPIRTMNRTAHFSEVFYDEVRIPLANVVGGLNEGWSVAMSTLSFERGTGFMADQVELARTVDDLIAQARAATGPPGRRPAIADEEVARRLATARAEVAALRAMTYASVSRNLRQQTPGPEASISKVFYAELQQRVGRLAMDILGHAAFDLVHDPLVGEGWPAWYLRGYGVSMGGGTPDIQRNIIAERVLGLPR